MPVIGNTITRLLLAGHPEKNFERHRSYVISTLNAIHLVYVSLRELIPAFLSPPPASIWNLSVQGLEPVSSQTAMICSDLRRKPLSLRDHSRVLPERLLGHEERMDKILGLFLPPHRHDRDCMQFSLHTHAHTLSFLSVSFSLSLSLCVCVYPLSSCSFP
jgi:hypothetical protein